MAFILALFDAGDYEAWKQLFDSDPVGHKETAKGHRALNADATNEIGERL